MKKLTMVRAGATAIATALCVSSFVLPAHADFVMNQIETGSRQAVTDAYKARYAPALNSKINWTGSVAGCNPGTQSADSLEKTESVINFYRGLSGLQEVNLNDNLNSRAQAAALMMQANQSLNHNPPSTWECYTELGAEGAATSNLFGGSGGYTINDATDAVDTYMTDPGASNTAAGHRRWLLNPYTTEMGVGTTTSYNALTVMGTPSNPDSVAPDFMPFPNAGYFPQQLEPNGRWSLSSNTGVDFSAATVAVKRYDTPLAVTKHTPVKYYGPDTLVFDVSGVTDAVGGEEVHYGVTVTGMKKNGVTLAPYTYTVSLFDPNTVAPPHTAQNHSIKTTKDIVAYDSAGTLWDYGTLEKPGETRRAIGTKGAVIPKAHFVTDWNADWVADQIVQEKSGRLIFRKGIETGGFEDIIIGSGWQNYDITVGRWKNTDLFPSIIARNNASGELFNYGNPKGQNMSSRVRIGNGWNGFNFNVIDWDKDGKMDILAKNSVGQMKLYRTNGAGGFISEARKTVGTGWNIMNSIRTVYGHGGPTAGFIARDTSGKLWYYPTYKGVWGARKQIGSGWSTYTIAGNS